MAITFIKLSTEIQDDPKWRAILKRKDGDAIFRLWIGMLCLAMKSSRAGCVDLGDEIPFTVADLAAHFSMKEAVVGDALVVFQKYKMIDNMGKDSTILITNFEKHQELGKIEQKREADRERQRRFRQRKTDGHEDVTRDTETGHAIDLDLDLEKDKDKDDVPRHPDKIVTLDLKDGDPVTLYMHYEGKDPAERLMAATIALWDPWCEISLRLLNFHRTPAPGLKDKVILTDLVTMENFDMAKVVLNMARFCRLPLDPKDNIDMKIQKENWPLWGLKYKWPELGKKAKQSRIKYTTKVVEKEGHTVMSRVIDDPQEIETQKRIGDMAATVGKSFKVDYTKKAVKL